MSRKTTLYIDIDETIIAEMFRGAGFDLRPCVMTHLTVLGRMYDCCWLTTWPYTEPKRPKARYDRMSIVTMMRCLYGTDNNERFRYAEWDRDHDDGKAEFVLRPGAPTDWYWLENPLFRYEREALAAAGKLDRYICVEPTGPWGFVNAVNELFRRSGKSANNIKHVGGRPEWFDIAAIAGEQASSQGSQPGRYPEGEVCRSPEETLKRKRLETLCELTALDEELGLTADADRVIRHVIETYGDRANEWLDRPLSAMQGQSPRDLLRQPGGAHRVETLLIQIDEGMIT